MSLHAGGALATHDVADLPLEVRLSHRIARSAGAHGIEGDLGLHGGETFKNSVDRRLIGWVSEEAMELEHEVDHDGLTGRDLEPCMRLKLMTWRRS